MVRKSTKTSAADKPARKRRGGRRKKDSSSESEPEPTPTVTEENLSAIALPKETKKEEEVVEAETSTKRNRRVSKRNAPAKDDNQQEEGGAEGVTEWSEDASFWTGATSSASASNEVVNEDEGSTWKIQSSNGSGGEIQKLKICRQRPTDSTGSSSPAKECVSPRVKRMAVPEKLEGENAELELDAPMDIVDVESEKVVTEQIPTPAIPTPPPQNTEDIPEPPAPSIDSTTITEEPIVKDTHEEIIIPGLDLVGEGQQKQDQLWMSSAEAITELSMIEMPPEVRSKDEVDNEIKNIEMPEELPSNIVPSEIPAPPTQLEEEVKDMVVEPVDDNSSSAAMETEVNIDDVLIPPQEDEQVESSVVLKEEIVVEESIKEQTTIEETVEEVAPIIKSETTGSTENISATATTPTSSTASKCLAGSLSVSSELAMEQIAKKLNERAARGKEMSDEKTIKTESSREESPENDRCIEEGEIVSSAAATPDPPPLSSNLMKPPSLVVKSEEVEWLPIKLKRHIEENSPEETIPVVSKKRICLSPQISITSDLLKLLEPDAQPVPIEELEFGMESDEGVEDDNADNVVGGQEVTSSNSVVVDMGSGIGGGCSSVVDINDKEQIIVSLSTTSSTTTTPTSPSLSTTANTDITPKIAVDVEVTVSNDVREVKKKKPIVIDRKSPNKSIAKTPPGPKLPAQENHKATRKISIVSADAKALRKSPSPSKKKATEVLYITNLVRPFTVPQLRELLARTGTIAQNGFYIDKIKSKCYVKYTDVEMAIETRHALHGVRWPVNNPKTLRVDFASPSDMAVVQKLADEEAGAAKKPESDATISSTSGVNVGSSSGGGWLNEQAALKPSRRVTATVREWDMGKIVGEESGANKTSPPLVDNKKKIIPEDDWSRKKEKTSRSDKERDRRRPHSPEHNKAEPPKKLKKKDSDAPARLLDDLFRKTKATPCIYWLPLTAAQIAVKEEMRRQHMAEHERRLAELRKTDTGSRRDNKDRDRDRDRDRRKK